MLIFSILEHLDIGNLPNFASKASMHGPYDYVRDTQPVWFGGMGYLPCWRNMASFRGWLAKNSRRQHKHIYLIGFHPLSRDGDSSPPGHETCLGSPIPRNFRHFHLWRHTPDDPCQGFPMATKGQSFVCLGKGNNITTVLHIRNLKWANRLSEVRKCLQNGFMKEFQETSPKKARGA